MKSRNESDFSIRHFIEKDIPAVMEFVDKCENLVVEREGVYWLFTRFFSGTCFLAATDQEIVGLLFGFLSQDDDKIAYVQELGTKKEWRNKGVASALLDYFANVVRQKGARKIFLTTYPDEANQEAIDFYYHRGFSGEFIQKNNNKRLGLWKQI